MRGRWAWALVGLILVLAGGLLAHLTQTSGGIRIQDVRFKGAKGNTMSALLYIPANATPQIPAPGSAGARRHHHPPQPPGGFSPRSPPPRLCGAGPRPDRPWLQRRPR